MLDLIFTNIRIKRSYPNEIHVIFIVFVRETMGEVRGSVKKFFYLSN